GEQKIMPTRTSVGSMFCDEFGVEVLVTPRHLRSLDSGDIRLAQLCGALDAPVSLRKPNEILVGQQHRARAAVLGDADRLAHGGVLIGAEIFRNPRRSCT